MVSSTTSAWRYGPLKLLLSNFQNTYTYSYTCTCTCSRSLLYMHIYEHYRRTGTGLATQWSRVRIPSVAAQFFSLSAFGLCLTFFPCLLSLLHIHVRDWSCIHMYMYSTHKRWRVFESEVEWLHRMRGYPIPECTVLYARLAVHLSEWGALPSLTGALWRLRWRGFKP